MEPQSHLEAWSDSSGVAAQPLRGLDASIFIRYQWYGLGAPTRVSPTAATKQKQHYENNQYGFHVVPHP
jgi:hypothetical protein